MSSGLQIILLIASLVFPILAQLYLRSVFGSASKKISSLGITGKETAERILKHYDLSQIPVNHIAGKLSDHYDPINKKLALSDSVYESNSIAAVAVAAHEVGHAIQDKQKYRFLVLRTVCYPVVGFSSNVAPFLIIGGLFFPVVPHLLEVGILFFTISVFFTLITLPVEFDASRRAMVAVSELGLVSPSEKGQAQKVLSAAALTYVAAAVTAVLELVRLLLIARESE
jgi:Zn-dependent membrane protease YugP